MNNKDLLRLGVPLGEPLRRATDFLSAYCLGGGDRSRLAEEIEAIVRQPALFTEDPLRGEFAKALLAAPPRSRTEPARYRQWGEGLEHEAVMQPRPAARGEKLAGGLAQPVPLLGGFHLIQFAAPLHVQRHTLRRVEDRPPAARALADGTAYVAAGIVNYDGTHVYALDAASGRIKWQNNTSGHLDEEGHSGISVQGQMMLIGDRLYLAGGNAVSPAMYDTRDGRCLNDPKKLEQTVNNNVPGSFSPRGNELYRFGNQVMVSGKPHYSDPRWPVYDDQVLRKTLLATNGDRAVAWVNNAKLLAFANPDAALAPKVLAAWGKPRIPELTPAWEHPCKDSLALAVGQNAAVVARPSELTAYALSDGRLLWTQPLPATPVPWGLALTRDGRIVVTLEGGRVLCFSSAEMATGQ